MILTKRNGLKQVLCTQGLSPFFDQTDNDDGPIVAQDFDKDPLGGHAFKEIGTKKTSKSPAAPTATEGSSATDVLNFFLETVEQASVPSNTPIAFLNDPDRQHALAHLRKMMMMSNPQECMLCATDFKSQGEIRFCPCCSMVSCAACVARRVFEVSSRQMVSVCVHCFRESSRVRHPPAPNTQSSNLKGWWRNEDLLDDTLAFISKSSRVPEESASGEALDLSVSLIPGLLEEDDPTDARNGELDRSPTSQTKAVLGPRRATFMGEDVDEEGEDRIEEAFDSHFLLVPSAATSPTSGSVRTARCKGCGEYISRDIEAIEAHMKSCGSYIQTDANAIDSSDSMELGGVSRKPNRGGCRIIYRLARSSSKVFKPREVCALQDSFIDTNSGTCYVYEVSVRHCEVRGISGFITAEVLLQLYAAAPLRNVKSQGSSITVISQVDSRAKGWLTSSPNIGAPAREDLVRELKAAGSLKNILADDEEGKGSVYVLFLSFILRTCLHSCCKPYSYKPTSCAFDTTLNTIFSENS